MYFYFTFIILCLFFFFSSRRRHTRCALVTGVQTCALPISGPVHGTAEGEGLQQQRPAVGESQHLGQARQRRYRDVERAVDRGLAVDVGDAAGEAAAAADEIGNRQLTHHPPALLQRGVQPETLERQPAVGELPPPQTPPNDA